MAAVRVVDMFPKEPSRFRLGEAYQTLCRPCHPREISYIGTKVTTNLRYLQYLQVIDERAQSITANREITARIRRRH